MVRLGCDFVRLGFTVTSCVTCVNNSDQDLEIGSSRSSGFTIIGSWLGQVSLGVIWSSGYVRSRIIGLPVRSDWDWLVGLHVISSGWT